MDPNCLETVRQQPPEHRATIPTGPDPKWRFFWRLSSDPSSEEYSAFQAEAVIPKGDALPLFSIASRHKPVDTYR